MALLSKTHCFLKTLIGYCQIALEKKISLCILIKILFSSHFVVQSLSYAQLFVTSWIAACQASLSFTISWSLLNLMSIESMMPSNHLVLCLPLLFMPSIFHNIRYFPNELALCIRQPKYWSFNINPSNEYSGLISFRIDWFGLFAVQDTRKSLPGTTVWQHQFLSTLPSLWSNSHICT